MGSEIERDPNEEEEEAEAKKKQLRDQGIVCCARRENGELRLFTALSNLFQGTVIGSGLMVGWKRLMLAGGPTRASEAGLGFLNSTFFI
ncbi:hypothetical protein GBA52_028839 [Prunus armeniaca]|nr:hypothetical protein GBA52_028839 [Prunus armeniaca]